MRHGTSLWGHDRDWLGAAEVAEVTRIRTQATEAGLRQPVQVAEGNYRVGAAPAAWWERGELTSGRKLG